MKNLESELEESQGLTRRYRDMYVVERDRANRPSTSRGNKNTPRGGGGGGGGGEGSEQQNSQRDGGGGGGKDSRARTSRHDDDGNSSSRREKVTEDDLDDDEAIFKRHIAKISEMKAMNTTSPIRIEDIIRKSEVRDITKSGLLDR